MTGEERTTTTAGPAHIITAIDTNAQLLIGHIREAQGFGNAHKEAALVRAHAALEEALRHLREAEAPFTDVQYEGQTITPVRVQDIDDPRAP